MRGIFQKNPVNIDDYLKDGSTVSSHRLKQEILKVGLKEHKCENCGLNEWLGNPIPIELDHINGKNNDNRLVNLKILCPNCHALTPTYRGRNKKVDLKKCRICDESVKRNSRVTCGSNVCTAENQSRQMKGRIRQKKNI
jgi:Zn finger protein HypA/HybF involved in hydrogenase expression